MYTYRDQTSQWRPDECRGNGLQSSIHLSPTSCSKYIASVATQCIGAPLGSLVSVGVRTDVRDVQGAGNYGPPAAPLAEHITSEELQHASASLREQV
jgi:hypothetical protein